MNARPKIAILACKQNPDPNHPLFKNKTLYYTERSMVRWVTDCGGIAFVWPITNDINLIDPYLDCVDGLLLQGGHDVCPSLYGVEKVHQTVVSDRSRDEFEIAAIKKAVQRKIPVLGVCRGMQIMNVALGGSLHQDIPAELGSHGVHSDFETFDFLYHSITIKKQSHLSKIYGNCLRGKVNSVHHQSISKLASELVIEAEACVDKVIEAVRYQSEDHFMYGVQWHPEFSHMGQDDLLKKEPLMESFLNYAIQYNKKA